MTVVSVVIPTYNRRLQLRRTIAALRKQTICADLFEVIVVSDGSTDGTDEELAGYDAPFSFHLIRQPNSGPAAARNRGAEASSGDVLLFIDDDVVPTNTCISAHVEAHARRSEPTVVIGPMLTPSDGNLNPWVAWEQRMLEKQYDAMARGDWKATARQFYTGNASMPRSLFRDSGGFDPGYRRAEDVELAYRLHAQGVGFVFEFEAEAFHYADRSYQGWLDIASTYGQNDAVFWRDLGQNWLLPKILEEVETRHRLTQIYVEVATRFPIVGVMGDRMVRRVVPLLGRADAGDLASPLLSAVYNMAYYRGLLHELGGDFTLSSLRKTAPAELRETVTASPSSKGELEADEVRID